MIARTQTWIPAAVMVLSLLVTAADGAESKSPFSRFLPFGGSDSTATKKAPRQSPLGGGFGNLASRMKRPSLGRPAEQRPSLLKRMNNGTRSFFSKTRDLLTPNKKSTSSPLPPPFGTAAKPNQQSSKKKSVFSNFFAAQEPEDRPGTVTEWLSLPKPE